MTNHRNLEVEVGLAKEILEADAVPALLSWVQSMEAAGLGEFRNDPSVAGVVGFVLLDEPNRAMVVVYTTDRDFEVDGQVEEIL